MIEKHLGAIILDNPTLEEKEAISGFMKKDYSKSKSITVNLKKFQKRLDETRFQGVTIKDLLENYYNENILSNQKLEEIYNEKLNIFFEEILLNFKNKKSANILNKILFEKSENYIKIKSDYNKNNKILKESLISVMKGIDNLPKYPQSLPIFSTNITGNPHYFDKNNLAGKLLIIFLEENEPEKIKRKNVEELSELYYKNNLLIDEMSNMVLGVNLIGHVERSKEMQQEFREEYKCDVNYEFKQEVQYDVHQGWLEFYKKHEPFQITLYNLTKVKRIETNIKKCLVVENPAVFTALISDENMRDFPIVCTYGQVKLAGIILLDYLVKSGTTLYYSGDIDPEGMLIADRLKNRFKESLKFIGFDIKTYLLNKSNVKISDSRLKKLKLLKDKELQILAEMVEQETTAAYEEKNIRWIIEKFYYSNK